MLVILMGGIYELRRLDGVMCQDIRVHTKFHKDWSRHSKVNRGDIHRHTHTQDRKVIS
jgi:hypothetical protein